MTTADCTDCCTPDSGGSRWQTAAMDPSAQLIVVGYAKVPAGSTLHASHEFLSVILRIDKASALVTDVDSTAVSALVRSWLSELLLGRDFSADIDDVLAVIDQNYLGHAAGSIRQAIVDAWRHYGAYRRDTTGGQR